jgi:tetratricopeptide (TPR) repeat protein
MGSDVVECTDTVRAKSPEQSTALEWAPGGIEKALRSRRMRKSLMMMLLVLAVAIGAVAQAAPAQEPAAGAAGAEGQQAAGQQKPAQSNKQIKDPAEYNAYMAAVNAKDPNAKAAALESFLQTYPNSVIKEDALELLMKTYQQLNNVPKIEQTGEKLLQVNPNNLTALALMAYLKRYQGLGQTDQNQAGTMLQQAGEYGQRGLQQLQTAAKPEGYSDADWAKMKESFKAIFAAAVGNADLNKKDYQAAIPDLQEALKANPNDYITTYQLAVAYLEQKPIGVDGLFWGAKAVDLAQKQNPAAAAQFQKYVKSKYVRYHGAEEGFDQLLATAQTATTIPAGFTVAPAPSPADQAAQMCAQTPADKMGFGEWEFIFTSGNQQCSDTVWNAIKGKKLQMQGKVLDVTPTVLKIAATEDAINANTPEITLNMTAPIPAKLLPKANTTLLFEGQPDSYTPNPFMMTMTDGTLLQKGAPAPAKKPAAGHRAPVHKKQ